MLAGIRLPTERSEKPWAAEAACLPGRRDAIGVAGGFTPAQKLLTTTTAATAFRGAGGWNRARTVSLGTHSLPGAIAKMAKGRVVARVPFRTRMSVDLFERSSRIPLCCNAFRVWSG